MEAPKRPNFFASLVIPDPTTNYDFLSAVYAFMSLLSVIFFVLEKYAVAESIHGFWIVPTPCIPCLLYCLFLRTRKAATTPVVEFKNKDQ